MSTHDLAATARALVADGKGILAADESFPTIEKRFQSIGIPSTEDNRRAYRELLFTAPGSAEYVSGVILFDETLRQKASTGKRLAEVLAAQNVIPGIKVDAGTKDLAGGLPGEKFTEGLDGLRKRLVEYRELGARFAKWRAVYSVSATTPSRLCIHTNAEGLASYAALCQEAGIVPIVEPEVLMDGTHTIERAAEVTHEVLHTTFHALFLHRVRLEGMLLKPNMVLAGYEAKKESPEKVAELTLDVLRRTVPPAVPGIVFLSGGQSDEDSTLHLDLMNKARVAKPWRLSFSYGRALQAQPLKVWGGKQESVAAAQKAYLKRAKLNGAATRGTYSPSMEREPVTV